MIVTKEVEMPNGRTPKRRDYPEDEYPEEQPRRKRVVRDEEDYDRDDYDRDRDYYERDRRGGYYDRDRDRGYYHRDRNGVASWLIPLLALLLLALFGWWIYKSAGGQNININQNQENEQNQQFAGEQRSGSFQNSIPAHGQTIPATPANVVIATNATSTS